MTPIRLLLQALPIIAQNVTATISAWKTAAILSRFMLLYSRIFYTPALLPSFVFELSMYHMFSYITLLLYDSLLSIQLSLNIPNIPIWFFLTGTRHFQPIYAVICAPDVRTKV